MVIKGDTRSLDSSSYGCRVSSLRVKGLSPRVEGLCRVQ